MALTMRPTGLGHGVYKDNVDYSVNRSGPKELRWFWALHALGGRETLRASNRVATLEVAKAEFEGSSAFVRARQSRSPDPPFRAIEASWEVESLFAPEEAPEERRQHASRFVHPPTRLGV